MGAVCTSCGKSLANQHGTLFNDPNLGPQLGYPLILVCDADAPSFAQWNAQAWPAGVLVRRQQYDAAGNPTGQA